MATSDIQAMQDGTPGTLGERVDALSGRVDTLGERVTRMETRMEYLATKEDVANIKVWVLVGVVSGSLAALGLLMTYHRFFILP